MDLYRFLLLIPCVLSSQGFRKVFSRNLSVVKGQDATIFKNVSRTGVFVITRQDHMVLEVINGQLTKKKDNFVFDGNNVVLLNAQMSDAGLYTAKLINGRQYLIYVNVTDYLPISTTLRTETSTIRSTAHPAALSSETRSHVTVPTCAIILVFGIAVYVFWVWKCKKGDNVG